MGLGGVRGSFEEKKNRMVGVGGLGHMRSNCIFRNRKNDEQKRRQGLVKEWELDK